MIKVGITGGIGSGKSTVCKVFELLGIPVFYADEVAKKILDEDPEVRSFVINIFGDVILDKAGLIEKKKLAALVFSNKKMLEQLNSVVHPAVRKRFETWCFEHKSEKYILQEAAILFESGAYKQVEKVIAVVAPVELKINRVMRRDSVEREQVIQRMKNQLSDDEKTKRSQFIVCNDEQQLLIPQVMEIHQHMMDA